MKPLALAFAAALLATSAAAQSPEGRGDRPESYERGGNREHGNWRAMHVRRMHELMAQNHEQEQGAARFRFRRGDARVDIQCSREESTNACVEAASRLIDKIITLRPGETITTPGARPSNPPAGVPGVSPPGTSGSATPLETSPQ